MTMVTVSASEIAKQVRGVTYSKGDAIETPSPGYIMLLRANNITAGGLTTDGAIYVPESKVSEKQRLQPGDIVVATSSGSLDVVGKASPVTAPINATFGAFCKVVRPNKKVDPEYLAQIFKSATYRQTISQLAAGANINNLRNEHIDDLQIPLPHKNGKPDLEEQKRIAAILDKADGIRRKRQQALRLTDDFLRSVFLDMFGDPVTNPRQWEKMKLADLIAENDVINYGVVQPGGDVPGGVPLVRAGDLDAEVQDADLLKHISPEIDKQYDRSRLRGGEVLIGCVGAVGRTMIAGPSLIGANVARAVARVNLRSDIQAEYVLNLLRTPHLQHYFHNEIRVVAQPTLNIRQIKETPVMLPPENLREQFTEISLTAKAANQTAQVFALQSKDLFASLQQRAFRGEL